MIQFKHENNFALWRNTYESKEWRYKDKDIWVYQRIHKNNRVSPTINEIAKNAGCAVSTAYKFLERLKDEGLIDTAGRGRLTSTVNNWEMGYAPILGIVACGKTKLTEDLRRIDGRHNHGP